MSVGVELLKRRNTVKNKTHKYIWLFVGFFVSLPAKKELVPTDCLDSIPPTLFFPPLLLKNQGISGSPVSVFLPWGTEEEATGSMAPPPAPDSSSGCFRHFHMQAAESTQLLQVLSAGAFTGLSSSGGCCSSRTAPSKRQMAALASVSQQRNMLLELQERHLAS